MKTSFSFVSILAVGLFVAPSAIRAQELKVPELPQDPSKWINSPPISLDDLKGKEVVLWFFSNECPHCRAEWPKLTELAKLYEGQPVCFIAINSGTSREAMEKYAHDTKLNWPFLVDSNRSYELQAGITPIISLQNICQVRVISPDGQWQFGDFTNVPKTIAEWRHRATWKVDPNDVPIKLVGGWEAIEFGNYRAAGPTLKEAAQIFRP